MDSPFGNSGTSGSPASSRSSPSPPTVHYYRSDSVVVEKPSSHVGGESPESFEFYSVRNGDNSRVEVLVIDQSQPTCNSSPQSPCSGYNSNKTTDDEGDNEGELDEGFGDELGDEGFPQLFIPDCPPHSDMIPTATFLDDFDPGVDMFDSTEQTIPTSEALKSPYNAFPPAGPGSPYQLVDASSSPVSIHTPQSQNNYNEYLNQVHVPSDASSTSSYSQHSGYMPTEEDELAMLLIDGGLDIMTSSHQPLVLPTSSCGQHTPSCSTVGVDFVTPNSLSYASSNFMTQANPSFSTPMLTSAQPSLMDLAEASQIAFSNNGFVNMSMGQLDTPTITQTPPNSTIRLDGGYSTASSVNNMTIPLGSVTSSMAGADMCSRSCQTTNDRLTRSLSPAPSVSHQQQHQHRHRSPSPTPSLDQYSVSSVGSTATTSGAYYCTPSPIASSPASSSRATFGSSRSSRKVSPVPASSDELVDMPYYQFKKILDDPSIDTNDKERVKNVRKRGKNKVAAKNCRQKKIEVVLGLQQQVDQMKERKRQLNLKCQGLEREINKLKLRCTSFRSLAYSQ